MVLPIMKKPLCKAKPAWPPESVHRREKPTMNEQIHSCRYLPKGLISIVIAAFCPPVFAGSGRGHRTRSASLLNRLANRGPTNLKVTLGYSPTFPTAGQTVQFSGFLDGSPGILAVGFRRWDRQRWPESDPCLHLSRISPSDSCRRQRPRFQEGRPESVTILPAAAAGSFVFSPTTPGPGQTVQFADTSSGNPTSLVLELRRRGDKHREESFPCVHATQRAYMS